MARPASVCRRARRRRGPSGGGRVYSVTRHENACHARLPVEARSRKAPGPALRPVGRRRRRSCGCATSSARAAFPVKRFTSTCSRDCSPPPQDRPEHGPIHGGAPRAAAPVPRTSGASVPPPEGDPGDPRRQRRRGFPPEQEDLVRRVRATLVAGRTRNSARRCRLPIRAGACLARGTAGTGARRPGQRARARRIRRGYRGRRSDPRMLGSVEGIGAGAGPRRLAIGVHIFDQAMEQLVSREARLAMRAYEGAAVEDVSRVVEQAAPIIGRLLAPCTASDCGTSCSTPVATPRPRRLSLACAGPGGRGPSGALVEHCV